MPALRTTQLNDLLTGEEKQPDKVTTVIIDEKSIKQRNPAYTAWMAHDQAVLGYLLSSLTRETLMYVSAMYVFSSSLAHARISLRVTVSCLRRQHVDCPHDDKETASVCDRLLGQDVSICRRDCCHRSFASR
jgi:hypothetical protein